MSDIRIGEHAFEPHEVMCGSSVWKRVGSQLEERDVGGSEPQRGRSCLGTTVRCQFLQVAMIVPSSVWQIRNVGAVQPSSRQGCWSLSPANSTCEPAFLGWPQIAHIALGGSLGFGTGWDASTEGIAARACARPS